MNRIRELRESKGIKQMDLVRRSGVCQQTVSSLEKDINKRPRIDTAAKIAAALGCTLDELVREEGRDG